MNRLLWTLQILLAVLFVLAGSLKLVLPAAQLAKQAPMLTVPFLRFVGICEVLGAIGLVLPGARHMRRELTPLASLGLVGIMIGAVIVTIMTNGIMMALFPFLVGVLAAFIAYGRWKRPREAAVHSASASR